MKSKIYLLPVFALLVACGGNGKEGKQAELDKLIVQHDALAKQIETLESELGKNTKEEMKTVSVKVTEIAPCVFKHYIEVQGKVDGDENVAVSPQTPGIITAVYCKLGDFVKKGAVLAELDAKVVKQSMEEVETQLVLATTIFEKQKALWDKKIGSEVQFLQAKAAKEATENRKKTLLEQLEMSRIKSPISGTIEEMPLKVGQMASPGMPNSAIRVVNMSGAKITAAVAEAFSLNVKKGNEVIVKFPDLNKKIETQLSFTSKFIDVMNRTFSVECKVASQEVELRANMIAYLAINDYTNENAKCLPVNVVQTGVDGKFVYVAVAKDNGFVAEIRAVKTGADYNGTMEIVEGLNAGDKLITSGYQNVKSGQQVVFN